MADKFDTNMRGAMWIKTSKSGLKYLQGSCEIDGKKIYVSCFKNTKKSSDNAPDWNLTFKHPEEDTNTVEETNDEELPF